jgi:hypothetical protein
VFDDFDRFAAHGSQAASQPAEPFLLVGLRACTQQEKMIDYSIFSLLFPRTDCRTGSLLVGWHHGIQQQLSCCIFKLGNLEKTLTRCKVCVKL